MGQDLQGRGDVALQLFAERRHAGEGQGGPEAGDELLVVTGFAPARGLLNEQDFVEFRTFGATQGVVVEPLADDLQVELSPAKVVVTRPGGLTLSNSLHSALRGNGLRPAMFDSQLWGFDRDAT